MENSILKFLNSWNHWKFHECSSVRQLNIIRNSGGLKTGSIGMAEECEDWGHYQNSMGMDSPKSALETKVLVPRAKNIGLIDVTPHHGCCLHMRVYWQSKGHLLPPALKEIQQTRTEHLLQWHAENWHKNILFTDEKIFTIEEQYSCQNDLCLNISWGEGEGSKGAKRPSSFLRHGMVWVCPIRGDTSSFLRERCENWCPSVSRG